MFLNRCLRNILGIWWPTLSSGKQSTKDQQGSKSININGDRHEAMRTICKHIHGWNVQCQKCSSLQKTQRRSMDQELAALEKKPSKNQQLARNSAVEALHRGSMFPYDNAPKYFISFSLMRQNDLFSIFCKHFFLYFLTFLYKYKMAAINSICNRALKCIKNKELLKEGLDKET